MSSTKRDLVGLAPLRLASGPTDRPPEALDVDSHARVAEEALDWQLEGDDAHFWELGAIAQGAEQDRAYALAGLIASAGEQLALANAAAVEVAEWKDVAPDEFDPEHEFCLRGMADVQCFLVLGAGHAVANVAVRALALHPELRTELGEKLRASSERPTFKPFSSKRLDWVSLNAKTCTAIRTVARSSGRPEVVDLVEGVAGLASDASWKALFKRRGEDFHRWRPQTHGVGTVARESPWTRDGNSRALGLKRRSATGAEGLAEEVSRIANEALLSLTASMHTFMTTLPKARGYLVGARVADESS